VTSVFMTPPAVSESKVRGFDFLGFLGFHALEQDLLVGGVQVSTRRRRIGGHFPRMSAARSGSWRA
jgi:hypothetical protein